MKKSIFTLSIISGLFVNIASAQISLTNDGYTFSGCFDQGTYNLCKFNGSGSGASGSTMNTGISGGTTVQAGGSVTVNTNSPGLVGRPILNDSSNNSSSYISSNSANNNSYSNTNYAYNTYYNGKRTYKVVSCDVYNNTYYSNHNYDSGSSMVNPHNRPGSQTPQYREDNGWTDVEFFDPDTKKSLGWGGALIAKQEVWFNNRLDHYEGDSSSSGKYIIGQPNDGWNIVQQVGQCEYPFDPMYPNNGGN